MRTPGAGRAAPASASRPSGTRLSACWPSGTRSGRASPDDAVMPGAGAASRHVLGIGLVAVFALALVVRLASFPQVQHGPLGTPDPPAYEDLGAKLHAGNAYESDFSPGLGGYPADLTRPPGYPAFLA